MDNSTKKRKRGPYKQYLNHGSTDQIPKRTLNGWKAKYNISQFNIIVSNSDAEVSSHHETSATIVEGEVSEEIDLCVNRPVNANLDNNHCDFNDENIVLSSDDSAGCHSEDTNDESSDESVGCSIQDKNQNNVVILDVALETGRNHTARLSLEHQPIPIIVGPFDNISACYVILENTLYESPSILHAFESVIQTCYAVNCEYPLNARSLWVFLQQAYLNVEEATDKPSVEVIALIGEIQNIIKEVEEADSQ